jgi:predicted PurR-regulated permease PerM
VSRTPSASDAPPRGHRALLIRDALIQLVLVAVFVALGLLLWSSLQILLLGFAGVLLAVLLSAPASFLAKRSPLSYAAGLALTLLLLLALVVGATFAFGPQIGNQTVLLLQSLPSSVTQVREVVASLPGGERLLTHVDGGGSLQPFGVNVVARVTGTAGLLWDVVAKLVFVIFLALLLALAPLRYRDGVVVLFPPSRQARAREVLDALGNTLRAWLVGQLIAMLLIGCVVYLGLWLLDVPMAFLLALIAGLFEFIPIVGPFLGFIPVALVTLSQSTEMLLYATAFYLAIQLVEGNLIVPVIQRRAVDLPPALTLAAVFLAAAAFGPLGMIVATPLAAVVLVLVKMLYLDGVRGQAVDLPGRAGEQDEEAQG